MEELYNELLEREEYLKSLKQTEQVKTRLGELTLVIVRVQQLLLPIVSKSFLTCKCGKQVKDLNNRLCFPCWNERYEASK